MKRRDFFKAVGWVSAGTLFFRGSGRAQMNGVGSVEQANPYAPPGLQGLSMNPEAYTYFTGAEAKFIEAAIARILPRDPSGPGALEAGVSYYIDQQLAGSFGQGARWYMQGPWQVGTPMQGYQLQYTPAEVYRAGISAAQGHARSRFGKNFEGLRADHQDDLLKDLDGGKVSDPEVPVQVTKQFFDFLVQQTVEGFLADPAYGGNRGKTGWQQLGFPGVYLETYANYVDKAAMPKPTFVSLADAQNVRTRS